MTAETKPTKCRECGCVAESQREHGPKGVCMHMRDGGQIDTFVLAAVSSPGGPWR